MKKAAKTRESNSLIVWLFKLINRVNGPGPISAADRQAISVLLGKISRDEDVRDLFFTTIKNRPKGDDSDQKSNAALLYEVRCRLGLAKPGKALRGEIAKLTGFTDGQVEHAVRDHGKAARKMISKLDEPALQSAERSMTANAGHGRRKK